MKKHENYYEIEPIIKVIGVGGGGGNAVENMYNRGIQGVSFAVCNTDIQALQNNSVPKKIQLGPQLTEGRGAGSKPEMGKEACRESEEEIGKFLKEDTKMLFITAGMGGGTGTGAAPVVAQIAKDLGILTVAIVTLPFKFEGRKRHRIALEGLQELKKYVDCILVVSNERLRAVCENLAIGEAFFKADSVLTTAAKGIAEIITVAGKINVDFEDVNTVMRGSGVAILGNAHAEGESRAHKAIQGAMNSPLLEDNDIRGAKNILLNITSGKKEITMSELGEITDYVQEEAGYGTDIIFGTCKDDSLGDKISVTIIATGFDSQNTTGAKKEREKVFVPLDVSNKNNIDLDLGDAIVIGLEEGDHVNTVELDVNEISSKAYDPEASIFYNNYKFDDEPKIKEKHNKKEKYQDLESARREYMRNNSVKNLENPKYITQIENEPAYKRRKVSLADVDDSLNRRSSRYEVSMDEDHPLRESGNSFLHDNVD